MNINENDRAAINKRLREYGSAYMGGLEEFEKDFDVKVDKKDTGYALDMTLRMPPTIRYTWDLVGGSMMGPSRPKVSGCSEDELETIDKILISEIELWVCNLGSTVLCFDVSGGRLGLEKEINDLYSSSPGYDSSYMRALSSRRVDDFGVLYYGTGDIWNPLICIWFDLGNKKIAGVWWSSKNSNHSKYIDKEEFRFLDENLRKHDKLGNFTYINDGLRGLYKEEHQTLSFIEGESSYRFTLGNIGYTLTFEMNKSTGEIEDVSEMHVDYFKVPDDPLEYIKQWKSQHE